MPPSFPLVTLERASSPFGSGRGAPLAWALAALAVVTGTLVALRLWQPRRDWVDLPPEVVAQARNAHGHLGKPVCGACHLERDRRLRADPVVLCQACHRFSHGNHPVNVPLGEWKQPGLPLWAGRVVCHTCHDPHDVRSAPDGLRLPFDELCKQCHRR